MFKKIYVSFNSLSSPEEEEIKKLNFLFMEKDISLIWEQKLKGNIKYATTLEIYILICFLRNKWYENIELLIKPSLFIFNNWLYQINNNKISELDIEEVWFFSVRWYNWNHPFFLTLKKIISKKWWKLTKTNYWNVTINDNWKFRPLVCLYDKRKKFIWDIIIPHWIKQKDYSLFKNFIINKLWDKVVFKRNFWEYWKEVYMVDLLKFDSLQEKKFNNALNFHLSKDKEIYITPFEEFSNEFRVYFTNFNNKPKVYSIKMKKINWDTDDIFKSENFYYKWKFKWSDVEDLEYKNEYKYIVDFSKKYIKHLDYTTWVLEFWEKINWGFMLFEVNHMAATLCTTKEDADNMNKYFHEIYENYL